MSDCMHEKFEETCSYAGGTGLPVMKCLTCDAYFSDEDLTRDAMKWAAEQAGADDDGWSKRYTDSIFGQGYLTIPWPDHMQLPHAAVEADPRVKAPQDDWCMVVIDGDVFRAMARALEHAR